MMKVKRLNGEMAKSNEERSLGTMFVPLPPPPHSFVSYKTMQEAVHAIEMFNNYELGRGVRLAVKVREKKEDRERRQQQLASDKSFCNTLNCAKDEDEDEGAGGDDGGISISTSDLLKSNNAGGQARAGVPATSHTKVGTPTPHYAKVGTPTPRTSGGDDHHRGTRLPCVVCKKPCTSKCAQCKTPYCSRPCQEEDWPSHKSTCGMSEATPPPPEGTPQPGSASHRGAESVEAVGCDDDEYDVSVPDELIEALAHDGDPTSALRDAASDERSPPVTKGRGLERSPPVTKGRGLAPNAVCSVPSVQTTPLSSTATSLISTPHPYTTPLSSTATSLTSTPHPYTTPLSSTATSLTSTPHPYTTPLRSISGGLSQSLAPVASMPLRGTHPDPSPLSSYGDTPQSTPGRLGTHHTTGAYDTALMAGVWPLLYSSTTILPSIPLSAPLPKVFRGLVTMVTSPVNFSAIVLCVETKELLRRLDALITEGPLIPVDADELTVGTRCGYKVDAPGGVLRVKVVDYDQDKVKLASYDFGGHLECPVSNLVMLPEALLVAPSLLVTCTLSVPVEESLGTPSANRLKDLVMGRVLRISWNPSSSVDPVSRSILCKFDIQGPTVGGVAVEALSPAPSTPISLPPKVSTTAAVMEPLRRMNPVGRVSFHLPPRTGTFLICPHVIHNPSAMWILIQHPGIAQFKRLQDDLTNHYRHTSNDNYVPEIGEICAVLRNEDQLFYRAEVRCVNNDGSIDVQYVDFGNCEVVSLAQIRHLEQVFLTLPRQALKAAMAGIAPPGPSNVWSAECVRTLREKMIGHHLVAEIVAESKGTYYLSVQDPVSDPAYFIQNGLVELGYAKFIQGHFESDDLFMSQVPCLPPMMMDVLSQLKNLEEATPQSALRPVTPALGPLGPEGQFKASLVTPVPPTKLPSLKQVAPQQISQPVEENVPQAETERSVNVRSSSTQGITASPKEGRGAPRRKLPVIVPPQDRVLNVQATHVETPYAFWMQMADPQSKKKLSDLTGAINKATPIIVSNPVAGNLCLARSHVDGILHRGQIASVSNSGNVKVQFLDYGNKEDVPPSEVYEIQSQAFVELQAQAMFCTLNKLLNPSGKDACWEPKALEEFHTLLPLDTLLKMKVVKTIGLKHVVDVMVPSGSGEKDLLGLFCKTGLGSMYSDGPRKSEGFNVMKGEVRNGSRLKDEETRVQLKEPAKDRKDDDESCVVMGSEGHNIPRGKAATHGPLTSPAPSTRQVLPPVGSAQVVGRGPSPSLSGAKQHLATGKQDMAHIPQNVKASSLPIIGIFKDDKYTLVTVTTVDTPHCFYVQAVAQSSIDELHQLTVCLGMITSSFHLQESSVAKGDLCCAKFSKDGCWYRAQVEEVSDTHCMVHFLDFGNTDRVVWSDVVQCPAECASVPVQAVRCALYGVNAVDSKWSSAATEVMQNLTVDKPLLARAHGQLSDGSFHVELIDTSGEKDINIATELISTGFAKLPISNDVVLIQQPHGTLPLYDSISPMCAKHNIKACNLGIATIFPEKEEFMLVTVTTVDTPHCFYIQAIAQSSVDMLSLITTELQGIAPTPSHLQKSSVAKGDLCCAKFSKDGCWYRAQVEEVSDTHCMVHFLDFGNTDRVVWSDVVQCPAECASVPVQAVRCALYGVIPHGSKWSPAATEVMQNLTVDKPLLARAHGQLSDGSFRVELIDTSGEKDINIATELVLMGVASLSEPSSVCGVEKSTSLETIAKPVPQPSPSIKASGLTVEPIFSEGKEFILVTVTTVDTPHCFYCQAVSQTSVEKLTLLSTRLQTIISSSPSLLQKSSVAKGDLCCAKFSKDGCWYRAQVEEVSDTHCMVHFLDFGNTDRVVWSDVVQCPAECASVPVQAVRCALYGVIPHGSKWSPSSAEALKELTVDKALYARLLSQCPGGPIHIELIGTSGDKDTDIAAELIAMGLAVPLTSPTVVPTSLTISPTIPSPQLPSGTFQLYVSDVTSPSSFHVHLHDIKALSQLQSIMEQLQSAYASPAPYAPFHPSPGASCCAKFTDGAFYRCRVVKVDSVGVTLSYVDYGNSCVVDASSVYCLDPKFASLPAVAIHCSLADVCPVLKDQWTPEAMKTFSALVFPSRDDVTYLKGNIVVGDATPVKVQLFLLDSGQQSVGDILIERNVAIPSNSLVPPGTVLSLPLPVITKAEFPVSIAHIQSPTMLYLYLLGPKYSKMGADLQSDISAYSSSAKSFTTPPKLGSLAIGRYKDGTWCRVRVLHEQKTAQYEYEVQYVDYGEMDVLSLDQLKPFPDKLLSIPEQIFQCALFGITAKEAQATSSALKQAVHTALGKPEYVCHVICRHPLIVDFKLHGNQNAPSLHNRLVQQKLLPPSNVLRLPSVSISPVGSTVLASVVMGPSDFWVQIVEADVAEKLAVLLERMNQFCHSRPPSPPSSPLVLGQLCCAKFSEDGSWYRARVVEFRGEAEVKVVFVDFGNVEWTSVDHIQEMREDFACLSEAALHCCLVGYEAKAVCDGEVIRLFKSLVENRKLVATKKGDVGVFQCIVELVDTSSDKDVYIHEVISSSHAQ